MQVLASRQRLVSTAVVSALLALAALLVLVLRGNSFPLLVDSALGATAVLGVGGCVLLLGGQKAVVKVAGIAAAVFALVAALLAALGVLGNKAPYEVSVEANPDKIVTKSGAVGGTYLVNKAIQDVGAPPGGSDSCAGRYTWARAKGAIDADSTTARVTVEGLADQLVQIVGIDAHVLQRNQPAVGSVLTCPGRGEVANVRFVSIDLDDQSAPVRTFDSKGNPLPFDFTVGKGQAETFLITAFTNKCDCSWEAVLHLRVGNETHDVTVQNGGVAFRTSASNNARSYRYIGKVWQDVSVGAPASPQGLVTSAFPNACRVVSRDELRRLVRWPGTFTLNGNGRKIQTNGVAVPVVLSECSFSEDRPAGSPAGSLHSFTVIVQGAQDATLGKHEFGAEVAAYVAHGQPHPRAVQLGQQAALFNSVLLVRQGRVILNLQESPAGAQSADQLQALGRTLLRRI